MTESIEKSQVLDNSELFVDVPAPVTAIGLFTLHRILSAWETQGLLRVHRQRIEIHDSPGLSGLHSLAELRVLPG